MNQQVGINKSSHISIVKQTLVVTASIIMLISYMFYNNSLCSEKGHFDTMSFYYNQEN